MIGGAAGDRPGQELAPRASGDRPSTSVIRAARAALLGLDGKRIAVITMVIADRAPEIVMFDGDPFLHEPWQELLTYRPGAALSRRRRHGGGRAMNPENVLIWLVAPAWFWSLAYLAARWALS
jgi:hypothetical protein